MNKRPAPRPPGRDPEQRQPQEMNATDAAPPVRTVEPLASMHPAPHPAPFDAPQDAPAAVPATRADLVGMLDDLRQRGGVDVADEAAILREYDALAGELRQEKARLAAGFQERLARDGEDDASAWLAGAAEALGRRQGERMRRLLQTIPALAPSQS